MVTPPNKVLQGFREAKNYRLLKCPLEGRGLTARKLKDFLLYLFFYGAEEQV